jgi:hypothetical protein
MVPNEISVEARRRGTADALLVTVAELERIRSRLGEAGARGAADQKVAAELGISVDELLALRTAINTDGDRATGLAKAAARSVAARSGRSTPGSGNRAPRPNAVYVLPGRKIYHLTRSCHSIASRQPEQLTVRAAKRADCRPCKDCVDDIEREGMRPIPDRVDREPSGIGTTVATEPTRAERKRQRDQQEAARLGISVEQLKDRRRSKAAADKEAQQEAQKLGLTVKEYKRRCAN